MNLERWHSHTGQDKRYVLEVIPKLDIHINIGTYLTLEEALKEFKKQSLINKNGEMVRIYRECFVWEDAVGLEEWEMDLDFEGNDDVYISNLSPFPINDS